MNEIKFNEININIEGYNVVGICVGCLNYNRKMSYGEDIYECFKLLGNINVPDGLTMQVCWECKAAVRNTLSFQAQILRAYEILHDYSQQNTFLNSPQDLTCYARQRLSTVILDTENGGIHIEEGYEPPLEFVKKEDDDQYDAEEPKTEPVELNNEDLESFFEELPSQDGFPSSDEDMQLSKLRDKKKKIKKEKKGKKRKKKELALEEKQIDLQEIEQKSSRKLKNLPEDLVELYTMTEEEMWQCGTKNTEKERVSEIKCEERNASRAGKRTRRYQKRNIEDNVDNTIENVKVREPPIDLHAEKVLNDKTGVIENRFCKVYSNYTKTVQEVKPPKSAAHNLKATDSYKSIENNYLNLPLCDNEDEKKPIGRRRKFPQQNRELKRLKLNTNQEYINNSGKIIKPKQFVDLKYCCVKNCVDKVPTEVRKEEFDKFWSSGSYEARSCLIELSVRTQPIKRRYGNSGQKRECSRLYSIRSINVCKQLYLKTFQISGSRVAVVLKKIKSDDLIDRRGQSGGKNKHPQYKYDQIVNLINSVDIKNFLNTNSKSGISLKLQDLYACYSSQFEDPVSLAAFKKFIYSKYDLPSLVFKVTTVL